MYGPRARWTSRWHVDLGRKNIASELRIIVPEVKFDLDADIRPVALCINLVNLEGLTT